MKPNKTLWRISVTTTPEAEDAVAEMLGTIFGQPAAAHVPCTMAMVGLWV